MGKGKREVEKRKKRDGGKGKEGLRREKEGVRRGKRGIGKRKKKG